MHAGMIRGGGFWASSGIGSYFRANETSMWKAMTLNTLSNIMSNKKKAGAAVGNELELYLKHKIDWREEYEATGNFPTLILGIYKP
mmetsp:Transcript_2051/g.3284  ORF Transcript_2051/g.3284 Transcript_2051/m.3284 type:complete len:86 (+) Transcript_2051:46-303(+)